MVQVAEVTVKDANGVDRDVATITALISLLEDLSPVLTSRLLSSAATTNSTLVKNAAGRLFSIQGYNTADDVVYLKLYNKATAPTVGTDTPVKTIAIPANTAFALDWVYGYEFSTGIGFGLTAAAGGADNSTAAVAAGDILGLNLDYR